VHNSGTSRVTVPRGFRGLAALMAVVLRTLLDSSRFVSHTRWIPTVLENPVTPPNSRSKQTVWGSIENSSVTSTSAFQRNSSTCGGDHDRRRKRQFAECVRWGQPTQAGTNASLPRLITPKQVTVGYVGLRWSESRTSARTASQDLEFRDECSRMMAAEYTDPGWRSERKPKMERLLASRTDLTSSLACAIIPITRVDEFVDSLLAIAAYWL
jgi:hypothetical protein